MSGLTVDLNADLGEGFGAYRLGDDAAMLDIVTSANVACGFHGGDPEIMCATFRQAVKKGVSVGAHPGFQDLWGFGRRVMPCSIGEIERIVAYQIGAAQAIAAYAGTRITHVKPHGALGNLTENDAQVAAAVLDAVHAVDPALPVTAIAFSHLERLARDRGMRVFTEIFADRAYAEDGHLMARAREGAVLHDPDMIADRVVCMVRQGAVRTVSGAMLPTAIDTICVHGDTSGAVAIARHVRARLEQAGVTLRSLG